MDQIYPDLLFHIFSFLNPKDLLMTELVCKKWKNLPIIDKIWYHHCLTISDSLIPLEHSWKKRFFKEKEPDQYFLAARELSSKKIFKANKKNAMLTDRVRFYRLYRSLRNCIRIKSGSGFAFFFSRERGDNF